MYDIKCNKCKKACLIYCMEKTMGIDYREQEMGRTYATARTTSIFFHQVILLSNVVSHLHRVERKPTETSKRTAYIDGCRDDAQTTALASHVAAAGLLFLNI
jgi:hypothetical protein